MPRKELHSSKPILTRVQAAVPPHADAPGVSGLDGPGEIVARPDGFHWIAPDARQEFGPFESLEALRAFRDAFDEGAPEPGETLQEAEREIGLSGWIDPETGDGAEGRSLPHLESE